MHNEVISGKGANCLNDITKVLEVPSKSTNILSIANPDELEMLANFDFENEANDLEDEDIHSTTIDEDLSQHSIAYLASVIEKKVLHALIQKGRKACSNCIQVFVENEVTDDDFIEFKSKTSNIICPCKSTIKLIENAESCINKYKSHNVTFDTMLAHIIRKLDLSTFYEQSKFDEGHNHKHELISLILKTYMDIKSTKFSKLVTRMSQKKQIRHSYLKLIHLEGQ